jgi:hypothetical protein
VFRLRASIPRVADRARVPLSPSPRLGQRPALIGFIFGCTIMSNLGFSLGNISQCYSAGHPGRDDQSVGGIFCSRRKWDSCCPPSAGTFVTSGASAQVSCRYILCRHMIHAYRARLRGYRSVCASRFICGHAHVSRCARRAGAVAALLLAGWARRRLCRHLRQHAFASRDGGVGRRITTDTSSTV